MRAIVVYESLWGHTAAVARAIAQGIGPDVKVVPTSLAWPEEVEGVDLLVVGAPIIAFGLPTEQVRENLGRDPGDAPRPPDLSHPSMRSWLTTVPRGGGHAAAFETRFWWSPGSAAKHIQKALEAAGYRTAAPSKKFIVTGKYGPLKAGEIDRAREWGAELARKVGGGGAW